MAIRTELTIVLENRPGAAARVFASLADPRINIVAMQLEHGGALRLVVDNPLHAERLLQERAMPYERRDVLYTMLPNDPGALARTAKLLADAGINVEYFYSTAVEGQPMATVVIGVPDVLKASAAAGI
ncbi:MAG TPA: hypothetical protein PLN93_02960 [Vicinamibacterales bacterium]|nr:hypothetical protein [Vicinamibacterales bacterium]HOG28032.1 hypothetical protein [Vicinamibacterales bacterium]HOQ59844.1 hypothetical protein [Vicinamibacterales bacterium]HPK70877.1 hypothetical protein [Vicinamibacterales bacterium]HPW20669.1 hypothetical protein [Vicinamibacterales bacterium]